VVYVGNLNIEYSVMSYFYVVLCNSRGWYYLENRIDPIAIIINGDYVILNWLSNVLDSCEKNLGSIFYFPIVSHED